MKIVVNKCYGGFGLSPLGIKEWAKRKGKECFFFDGIKGKTQLTIEEATNKGLFYSAFSVPNPNEVLKDTSDWANMTKEEREENSRAYKSISPYAGDIERTDPDLVAVVEQLGKDANGQCAKLEVIEIPDGIDYEIDEYDGIESIHEKHRSW